MRQVLLGMSRNEKLKEAITRVPATRSVVNRFMPGETVADVVAATAKLAQSGIMVTIDHLGEDATRKDLAQRNAEAYTEVLDRISAAGLASGAEVSVKLSAIGQALPGGEDLALEQARGICAAARNAGMTVTLDMEDHTTVDSTLGILDELRRDYPDTGGVIQAYLYRSEEDCAALTGPGSRIRLCKGSYAEPAQVAFTKPREIDRAYVRCLRILMEGQGYPMVATHDPRLVAIALDLTHRNRRGADDFEIQMLYGIRPNEQERLAGLGHRMRVYLPYGQEWYGYLVRRLAEKPSNLAFFLRGLVDRN